MKIKNKYQSVDLKNTIIIITEKKPNSGNIYIIYYLD